MVTILTTMPKHVTEKQFIDSYVSATEGRSSPEDAAEVLRRCRTGEPLTREMLRIPRASTWCGWLFDVLDMLRLTQAEVDVLADGTKIIVSEHYQSPYATSVWIGTTEVGRERRLAGNLYLENVDPPSRYQTIWVPSDG